MPAVPPFASSQLGAKPSDSNAAFRHNGAPAIVCPWRLPFDNAVDLILDGLNIGDSVVNAQDVDIGGAWDASAATGSKFTDDTTDINDVGVADVAAFPATEVDELDFFLLGQLTPFFGLTIVIATPGVGGTVAWEYLNSSGVWATIAVLFDGSSGFTAAADTTELIFEPPEDWALDAATLSAEVDSTARYYIRARVTSVYSTNPILDQVSVKEMNASAVDSGFIAPSTGVIDAVTLFSGTVGGGNDGRLMVINHTEKKRGIYAFVFDEEVERVGATKGCHVFRGDVCTWHITVEDGTTEPNNVHLIPEIAV